MLVLSRRARRGESRIQILTPSGEEIWVTVTEVDRGKVRLGFIANTRVRIMREELLPEQQER